MRVGRLMDELGGALEELVGLRVFPYSAPKVVPPAAVVGWPDQITYDATMARGGDSLTLPVWVIVSHVDARSARDVLAAFLDGSGPSSVKAALERGVYTACDSVRVTSARVEPVSIAGTDFLAAVLDVEVNGNGRA